VFAVLCPFANQFCVPKAKDRLECEIRAKKREGLLNEFLKEHRRVTEQQTKVAEQESTIAELKAALAKQQATNAQQQQQIESFAAGLQKVSAAVELNKPAPTQVADNR
jgi:uncharacterized coiled-coil protein SlyX